MDGIQDVLNRIDQIRSRFTGFAGPVAAADTDASRTRGPQSATFASALAEASAGTGTVADHQLPSGVSSTQFGTDLLRRLGLPVTTENLRVMDAWARAEGTSARFNPLATTQSGPGATSFNSVGVKNYPSYAVGLDATARVMVNGKYGGILAALARGNNADEVARAIAASPWGTGEGALRVLHSSG